MRIYYFSVLGNEQAMDIQHGPFTPEEGDIVDVHVGHGRMCKYRVEAKDAQCVMLVQL